MAEPDRITLRPFVEHTASADCECSMCFARREITGSLVYVRGHLARLIEYGVAALDDPRSGQALVAYVTSSDDHPVRWTVASRRLASAERVPPMAEWVEDEELRFPEDENDE